MNYYDEYENQFYNPDDDDAKPGANLNWKKIQRGFKRVEGATAEGYSLVAEGYAKGTQNGEPVEEGSIYYQNNAKYYADDAGEAAQHAEETAQHVEEVAEIIDNELAVKKNLNKVKWNWSFISSQDNPTGWRTGNYIADGTANTQEFYMRTLVSVVDIIRCVPGAKYFTITAPKVDNIQYAIAVCEYDNTGAFIERHGVNDIRQTDATKSVSLPVTYGHTYKFALGRFADNNSATFLTTEFTSQIELIIYYDYNFEDINDYYFPYLNTPVNAINDISNSMSEKSFGFVFITDYHTLRNANQSPKLINYLMKHTGIHNVVFGGDAFQSWPVRAEQNDYVNRVYQLLSRSGEDSFYCVTGNHEYNDIAGQQNTQTGVNAFTTDRNRKNADIMDQYGNYYIDEIMTDTRIFFISCTISGGVPWTSILWLANQLLDVPSGFNVMVIGHSGVLVNGSGQPYQLNTQMNVSKLLGAFDRSESVTLYDSDNVNKGTFDYTSKNGTTICFLCGHTHEDISIEKATDENGVLLIGVTGDLYYDASGTKYTFEDGEGATVTRNIGTIYEQAFDVVQIDTVAKKVYCTRIGAGIDREFSY